MNQTHEPGLRSWVESAQGHPDFPIQNLPVGVFRPRGSGDPPSVGIAIGDQILSLAASAKLVGVPSGPAADACAEPSLNRLMELGRSTWTTLRAEVSSLLSSDSRIARNRPDLATRILVPMADAELLVPAVIGDYSDFYASVHHATNVGSMFRPNNPLLPNYKWVPIGYHGRASSIVPSGTPVRRPQGQIKGQEADRPVFAASQALDYEAEMGCFVGPGNSIGEPVSLDRADEHLFGLCLVNDWSARDIQTWEYQPLGPFLSKSFATSISPWVVTLEALEPYRVPAFPRAAGDPRPLTYLYSATDQARGGIDVTVEVYLLSAKMRDAKMAPQCLSRSKTSDLYWTLGQMLAHHTSNGCNLRPGDLFASGTISGVSKESRGCLLELTWRGSEPITLPSAESRTFLEDGDEVIMRAYCQRAGQVRIGFGECRGRVMPARAI